jgi:hypothetical protein
VLAHARAECRVGGVEHAQPVASRGDAVINEQVLDHLPNVSGLGPARYRQGHGWGTWLGPVRLGSSAIRLALAALRPNHKHSPDLPPGVP